MVQLAVPRGQALSLDSYNSGMVAVAHAAPQAAAPQAVSAWLDSLVADYSDTERASLADAFEYARARTADAAMADGEPRSTARSAPRRSWRD
jgi:hypothetical protein